MQKRIKNEHQILYDVSRICYLADLTVKAGLKALPVDIDQSFIDVTYYYSSKRKQEFVICGALFSQLNQRLFLNTALLDG